MENRSAINDFIKIINFERHNILKNINTQLFDSLVLEVFRNIDLFKIEYHHDIDNEGLKKYNELYHFGWNTLLSIFYKRIKLKDIFHEYSSPISRLKWSRSLIMHAGNLGLYKQFIDFEKAGLGDITKQSNTNYIFSFKGENLGIEKIERISYSYLYYRRSKIIEEEATMLFDKYDYIKECIKNCLRKPGEEPNIQYKSTSEIDDFYKKFGRLYFIQEQDSDDFCEEDVFGGIKYKDYIEYIQEQIGIVMKHIDFCLAYILKYPSISLYDILSKVLNKKDLVDSDLFCNEKDKLEQIFSCLCLNQENCEYHLDSSASPLPPFVEISKSQIIRSTAGLKHKPCLFLKRELKRRFPNDYFNAVNRREDRFRNELYNLIVPNNKEQYLVLDRSVIIKFNDTKTDIDAAVYDKITRTLGVFQLKWQDSFGNQMQERRSRISNMIPKAEEWIEKITQWGNQHTSQVILNALGFDSVSKKENMIDEVLIFVISRNHMHFTNVSLDERGAWASWYQLIEIVSQKTVPEQNLLKDLYLTIKETSPEKRISKGEINLDIPNGTIKLSKYTLQVVPPNKET